VDGEGRTKSLLKKPPTSSVVDGPPIFINTIAVGPLELVGSWVTGGTDVARYRNWSALLRCHNEVVGVLVSLDTVEGEALLVTCVNGRLKAILFCFVLAYGQEEIVMISRTSPSLWYGVQTCTKASQSRHNCLRRVARNVQGCLKMPISWGQAEPINLPNLKHAIVMCFRIKVGLDASA